MEAIIEKRGKEWVVILRQDNQSFELAYRGNEEEAAWMADMFKIALQHHDKVRALSIFTEALPAEDTLLNDAYKQGFNECRSQTLSNIKKQLGYE